MVLRIDILNERTTGGAEYVQLRPNNGDRLYDQQLMRDLHVINARTVSELGPLPVGGIPLSVKRKPDVSYSKINSQVVAASLRYNGILAATSIVIPLQSNHSEERMINKEELKAAAENLEWVLRQYPDSGPVQEMLVGLGPLIEAAKAGEIVTPLDSTPFSYDFSDGAYIPYKDPNVGEAYAKFSIEIQGGLTNQDKQRLEKMSKLRKLRKHGEHEHE